MTEILCKREQCYVGSQLTFWFERKRINLEDTEVTRGLVGHYVERYAYADGRLDVRWKGYSLPDTVFDEDQRVTPAITQNKRLGDVLAYIKERKEQPSKPDVKTNSDKNGHLRRTRGPGRRKDFMDDPGGDCTAREGAVAARCWPVARQKHRLKEKPKGLTGVCTGVPSGEPSEISTLRHSEHFNCAATTSCVG